MTEKTDKMVEKKDRKTKNKNKEPKIHKRQYTGIRRLPDKLQNQNEPR